MATTRVPSHCGPDRRPSPPGRVWSIVLAGGDGTRLMGSSVLGERIDRPKQFCRFGGRRSLLGDTLDRVFRLTRPSHLLPVVSTHHHAWWAGDLRDIPVENVVVQPRNRGTTVAILHALIAILERDVDAIVVVHPCDHGVEHQAPLLAALDQAIDAAARSPDELVLLGMAPKDPETEYGWIIPGPGGTAAARRVGAFVEKPPSPVAHRLMEQGGLWNAFTFAVSAQGLLRMLGRSVPHLVDAYLERMSPTGWRPGALAGFYESIPASDFSRDVLERCADALRVVPVSPCGWTDLGTPARVEAWLERKRTPCGSPPREDSSPLAACASS